MFNRLKAMTSASWGESQATSMVIYKSVFLPRITYGAEIWATGTKLKNSIASLRKTQRQALLAVTGAYRTFSTASLQVIAWLLPLDLEVYRHCAKAELKRGAITQIEHDEKINQLLDKWQERWSNTSKGEWTQKLMPQVKARYGLLLVMNHYLSQMMTGHGDFRGKLRQFKLVPSANCACGNGSETVQHVLLTCPRVAAQRDKFRRVVYNEGEDWPPYQGTIIKTRKIYKAFKTFAEDSLKNRNDR